MTILRARFWFVALAAFSLLILGGTTPSAAAKHAKSHAGNQNAKQAQHKPKNQQQDKIEVTVLGRHGQPVAGATVHLRQVAHHKSHAAGKAHAKTAKKKHHHASRRTATTNAQGHAVFKHVRPGHYHLTAEKKGVGHGSAKATLKAGQTKSVKIHLARHRHRRKS